MRCRYQVSLNTNHKDEAELIDYLSSFERGKKQEIMRMLLKAGFSSMIQHKGSDGAFENAVDDDLIKVAFDAFAKRMEVQLSKMGYPPQFRNGVSTHVEPGYFHPGYYQPTQPTQPNQESMDKPNLSSISSRDYSQDDLSKIEGARQSHSHLSGNEKSIDGNNVTPVVANNEIEVDLNIDSKSNVEDLNNKEKSNGSLKSGEDSSQIKSSHNVIEDDLLDEDPSIWDEDLDEDVEDPMKSLMSLMNKNQLT